MADRRLVFANATEQHTQEIISAYRARLEEITEQRGTKIDPEASDTITDETVLDRLINGTPLVPVLTNTDFVKSQETAASTSPLHKFVEADGLVTESMRGVRSTVEDRLEDNEARLGYLCCYAQNNSILAVIDGTGRKFVASASAELRQFLDDSGYEDVDRNFNVPLSNGETIIGLKGHEPSYAVHLAVSEILNRQALHEDLFTSSFLSPDADGVARTRDAE